jgi:hypothetical protein
MSIAAILFLCIAALAWLAPAVRAFRNGKTKLGLIALATGPVAVCLYMLDRHPNVAVGAFLALVVGGGILWRNAAK